MPWSGSQRPFDARSMYELHVEGRFAAAHLLRDYPGKCERLHGHNWRVQVVLQGESTNHLGMLMDFKDAKALLGQVVGQFDHRYLNELPHFKQLNPTTENVARIICRELARRLPEDVSVRSVTAWESEGCGTTYRP